VTDTQLQACVEEQCIEILARIIAADSGIFVFHRDSRVSARTEIVQLNSDRILLEATRRTDELSALKSILPEAGDVLMLSPSIDNHADQLNDAEVQIASVLYGRPATLRELTARIGLEEVLLWKTIVSMRSRGWVVAAREQSIAPRQPAGVA
jgi:hypothetical protein